MNHRSKLQEARKRVRDLCIYIYHEVRRKKKSPRWKKRNARKIFPAFIYINNKQVINIYTYIITTSKNMVFLQHGLYIQEPLYSTTRRNFSGGIVELLLQQFILPMTRVSPQIRAESILGSEARRFYRRWKEIPGPSFFLASSTSFLSRRGFPPIGGRETSIQFQGIVSSQRAVGKRG